MPQVTVYIREEDIDKWKAIRKKSRFISVALQTLSEDSMDFLEDQHQKYDTPTPVKQPAKESPAIRNLADVTEENEELPLVPDPTNPKRAWDPNNEEWVRI